MSSGTQPARVSLTPARAPDTVTVRRKPGPIPGRPRRLARAAGESILLAAASVSLHSPRRVSCALS
jgi:hypothetical protein